MISTTQTSISVLNEYKDIGFFITDFNGYVAKTLPI